MLGWLLAAAAPAYRLAVVIYASSLLACLIVSAVYHLGARTPVSQLVMQRVDRATIYLLIAGTYTPALLVITTPPATLWLLNVVWVGAAAGIVLRGLGICNRTATALYLVLGWVGVITGPALWAESISAFVLTLAGGLAYTLGAAVFGMKRPVLSRTHFSHHEVFHALTLAGMASQFAAIVILTVPGAS